MNCRHSSILSTHYKSEEIYRTEQPRDCGAIVYHGQIANRAFQYVEVSLAGNVQQVYVIDARVLLPSVYSYYA